MSFMQPDITIQVRNNPLRLCAMNFKIHENGQESIVIDSFEGCQKVKENMQQ